MERNSEDCNKEIVQSNEASSSSEDLVACSPCKPDSGSPESSENKSSLLSSSKNSFSLRSSVLGSTLQQASSTNNDSSKTSFVLNPPRLSNPFVKPTEEEKETELSNKEKGDQNTSSPAKNPSDGSAGGSKLSFVPLGWSNTSSTTSGTVSTSTSAVSTSSQPTGPTFGSFVFGQNLRDKVENPKPGETETEVSSTTITNEHENNVEEPKANGTTSEMLFSSAVKSEASEGKSTDGGKSLSEAAREYEEARSVKRKFEPVQLITGEEHEQNVLQMNCKLFAYDKISAGWQERGRGLLRLNDSPPNGSRLIIRAHGSLRVLINTQVWSGMIIQRASPKSLRITAMDTSASVKVFLVSASQTEIDELQRYLESRVRKLERSNDTNAKPKKLRAEDTS